MSPGTKSLAFILWIPGLFCLNTFATSGSYSFKASIALSAFLSWKKNSLKKLRRQIDVRNENAMTKKDSSCTHLPNTNDCVYYQNNKNYEWFYKCCGPVLSFLEQRQYLDNKKIKHGRSRTWLINRSHTYSLPIYCNVLEIRLYLWWVNKLTKEITAAARRIFISKSSNCSSTSFHSGLPEN